MSRAAGLERSALELLLAAFESGAPLLSGAALKFFPDEAAYLKGAALIKPNGHQASAAAVGNHSDNVVSLTWEAEQDGYGYFSEIDGWVSVPHEETKTFTVDLSALGAALTRKLKFSARKPPLMLVPDHLWEIGSAYLIGTKPTPILFGRRLWEPTNWEKVSAALRNRPCAGRRAVLTSTRGDRIAGRFDQCAVIPIIDVLSDQRAEVDQEMLSARLRAVPGSDPDSPVAVFGKGREVRLADKTFRFHKGVRQREIICLLAECLQQGERWVSSDFIVAELGLGERTRIRDIFKKHPAWGVLLTEHGGMCGFCLDEPVERRGQKRP